MGITAPWVAALLGCQPSRRIPVPVCDPERPAPGEVIVAIAGCSELVPAGGEGGPNEVSVYVATHHLRAMLRHPADALSVAGVGGATLIDAAPWGGPDVVHEVVPLVGGAWLTGVEATLEADAVRVEGLGADGERHTVTWRPDPDGPWIVAEGADALYIDPAGDAEVLDGLVLWPPTVVGAVGAVTDTGVLVVEGTDRLLVADHAVAWEALAGEDAERISGTATGADRLTLLREDGRPGGRVPVDGAFDLVVPAWVEQVRADAWAHAPSPAVPAGTGLELAVGAEGTLRVEPEHDLLATWTTADGLEITALVEPAGADLPLGAGVHEVRLSGGPNREALELHVELAGLETLGVSLDVRNLWEGWVAASFARPADTSPEWRGSDTTAIRLAAGENLAYATFAPVGNVSATGAPGPFRPSIPVRDGSTYVGDGWRISAWPWNSNDRKPLHGALVRRDLGPTDAAAAMRGDDHRRLLVDLGWLAKVVPGRLDFVPDFVRLEVGDPATWEAWFAWLDAGRQVVPVGPYVWVPVIDPDVAGLVDVEQPLYRGRVSAGDGGLLEVLVDGTPPGEVLPTDATGDTGAASTVHTVTIEAKPASAQNLALFTNGGRRIDVVPGRNLVELDGTWVVAAAWSASATGPWAVTGPVWLRAPSQRPPSPPPR